MNNSKMYTQPHLSLPSSSLKAQTVEQTPTFGNKDSAPKNQKNQLHPKISR